MIYTQPPDALSHQFAPGTVRRVLGGYLLAGLSAGLTIAIIATMTNMLAGKAGGGHWGGLIGAALILSIVASGFVFVLTFIPAAIFIVWSEARSYRKCGVHVAAGIGMSILAILSLHATNGGSDLASTPDAIAGMLGGGIVAGAVYWAISGKRAGNWRHESA